MPGCDNIYDRAAVLMSYPIDRPISNSRTIMPVDRRLDGSTPHRLILVGGSGIHPSVDRFVETRSDYSTGERRVLRLAGSKEEAAVNHRHEVSVKGSGNPAFRTLNPCY